MTKGDPVPGQGPGMEGWTALHSGALTLTHGCSDVNDQETGGKCGNLALPEQLF
jgi:hypothetical protein